MMDNICPNIYWKYVTIDTEVNEVLYSWMLKSVYEIMKSDLLYHLKIINNNNPGCLQLRPFELCIAKNAIEGE